MSEDFECFVTFGDKKHTICLNKDIESVIFSDVYKQLTQFSVKPVICFDNYIFEVFDFEDNCFQRLTSVETPIKYLSRIRVLPKNSNNGSNCNSSDNKPKGFQQKFNDDFFDVEAEAMASTPLPQRLNRPSRDWHNFKEPYGEPKRIPEEEELEMNENFYNSDMYYNTNKRMRFSDYPDYGADGSEYNYFGPPAPSLRPYIRRSDMIEPIAGPSFTDPYGGPPPQPYYRRRDDYFNRFIGPPEEHYSEYPPYYRPNEPQMHFRPDFIPNPRFRPHFGPEMDFRPNFGSNFRPNSTQNSFRQQSRGPTGYRVRGEQHTNTTKSIDDQDFIKDTKTLNYLRFNGFTIETINGIEFYFCEFCETKFKPISIAYKHIKTDSHLKNSNEKNLDPLDKLLLVKTQQKGTHVSILRRQELRKISKLDKQKLIRHGIRIKDATGPQAYVCIRCCSSLSSLTECHKHYDTFFEINKSINYPKDYHLLTEDNSHPKVELRYRRILNALELLIEENRSEEELKHLIELRNEGVVLKESIDGSNIKYFTCLVCDKKFDTKEEALTHSKTTEHLTKRSPKRYRGLDKALITDSERCNQIEVVLARKQELEKVKHFIKELNFEHGIRLKDGIGPEAYFCTKCDQWFDSSNTVKIHIEEYDKRVINESTEEFLIESAKKQMELLSKNSGGQEWTPQQSSEKEITGEEKKTQEGSQYEGKEGENTEQEKTEEKKIGDEITEEVGNGYQRTGDEITEKESSVEECTPEEREKEKNTENERTGEEGKGDERMEEEITGEKGIGDEKTGDERTGEEMTEEEQMDTTADKDKNSVDDENCKKLFEKEGIIPLTPKDDTEDKYYDIFCDIHLKDKEEVMEHLNRSFHKRLMSGEFLSDVDKAFCVSTDRMNDAEVVLSRFQVLERLDDELKEKFTEEGIRLMHGVGKEAFWCTLCNDSILSPNVESSAYSFINHINYNPKHVALLIGQNK